MVSPEGSLIPLSFMMEIEATNNVAEYEEFILGLQEKRNMNIECLIAHGDSKLIVKKIRNQCQDKNPRLRTYQNEVWDLIVNFFLAFNIQSMMREGNKIFDSLVVVARNFKPPQNLLLRYEVEVKQRPSTPNNVKHYQVFEDD